MIASFNADADNDGIVKLEEPTVTVHGYSNLWSSNDSFPVNYNNGIYNYTDNSNGYGRMWWVASPNSDPDYIFFLNGPNSKLELFKLSSGGEKFGRPIVCISTNDFNNTYTLEDN